MFFKTVTHSSTLSFLLAHWCHAIVPKPQLSHWIGSPFVQHSVTAHCSLVSQTYVPNLTKLQHLTTSAMFVIVTNKGHLSMTTKVT